MFKTTLLAVLPLLLLPASAFAANNPHFCHTPAELSGRVDDCMDNAYYAEAAVMCIDKFKEKVNAVAGLSSAALATGVNKMTSAQNKNFDTTGKSYQLSEAALAALLAEGKARQKEADAYLDELVYPEDAGEGGGDAAEDLKSTSCYQENADALVEVRKDFGEKIAQLESALGAATHLQGVSDGRETKMDDIMQGADAPLTAQPTVSSTPRKGKDYRPSDVTGTKKPTNK